MFWSDFRHILDTKFDKCQCMKAPLSPLKNYNKILKIFSRDTKNEGETERTEVNEHKISSHIHQHFCQLNPCPIVSSPMRKIPHIL